MTIAILTTGYFNLRIIVTEIVFIYIQKAKNKCLEAYFRGHEVKLTKQRSSFARLEICMGVEKENYLNLIKIKPDFVVFLDLEGGNCPSAATPNAVYRPGVGNQPFTEDKEANSEGGVC